MTKIGRDDILDGLAEVARRAGAEGASVKVHVLGGSAVALLLNRDRRLTGDVDAHIVANGSDLATITRVAAEVAAERGLRPDWLNTDAEMFLPSYGEPFGWVASTSRRNEPLITWRLPAAPSCGCQAMSVRHTFFDAPSQFEVPDRLAGRGPQEGEQVGDAVFEDALRGGRTSALRCDVLERHVATMWNVTIRRVGTLGVRCAHGDRQDHASNR